MCRRPRSTRSYKLHYKAQDLLIESSWNKANTRWLQIPNAWDDIFVSHGWNHERYCFLSKIRRLGLTAKFGKGDWVLLMFSSGLDYGVPSNSTAQVVDFCEQDNGVHVLGIKTAFKARRSFYNTFKFSKSDFVVISGVTISLTDVLKYLVD